MKKALLICAVAATISTSASAQEGNFPEGAEPFSQEALREVLAGKVFTLNPAKGLPWRWQFDSNGYFFFNAGNFYNSGKWSTKDSTVCQDTGKTTGCNEVRQKDNVLYLKRNNGEILILKQQ